MPNKSSCLGGLSPDRGRDPGPAACHLRCPADSDVVTPPATAAGSRHHHLDSVGRVHFLDGIPYVQMSCFSDAISTLCPRPIPSALSRAVLYARLF
jgi:hypothetical protein